MGRRCNCVDGQDAKDCPVHGTLPPLLPDGYDEALEREHASSHVPPFNGGDTAQMVDTLLGPRTRSTHTVALLEISTAAFDEIRQRLDDAHQGHHFMNSADGLVLDMNGVGLIRQPESESDANKRQVAGSHYSGYALQHWDLVVAYGWDYFQGQITKYLMRHKKKNGVQDLEKAAHFLEKYIEVEKARIAREQVQS